ncbi:MAG: glycosyltransferase family 4 protein [Chlorobiaceae bacterium]|nr:glycosyltransferase family 4 protein [Chlorobiaceae bacterium]
MNAAIYYHPEAYTTNSPKLMGRNAAGESFLRGYLQYARADSFWTQVQIPEHAQSFAQAVKAAGRSEPVTMVDKNSIGRLSQPGVVYHPGPGIGDHAWQRSFYGHGAWSLCGITHTTASAGAMDALAQLLAVPVQPWDAVICTSNAVKNQVIRLLQAQADYLVQRFCAQRFVMPQFPVIPLGIHTGDFQFSEQEKAAARAAVGADEDTLVVLYAGRLSFHAKAHPLAMYQALEMALTVLPEGKRVLLVECGWHANDFIAKAYSDAASQACPGVRVVSLDGRNMESRKIAWACADVFCSLSDNIQETFGIVPVEAMAAGLPVVVSDWDGYRDTVRHEVDGFRVPTLMPGAGTGRALALRHALEIDTYDVYCGFTCSFVAVDVHAAADAFRRLFESSELRKTYGEAGRRRAGDVYDWAVIIPQYEALWEQLKETRRAKSKELTRLPHPWPARMDPFDGFAGYSTRQLAPHTMLGTDERDPVSAMQRVSEYRRLAMVNFAGPVLPTADEIEVVLSAAFNKPKPAGELIQEIPADRQSFVFRSLVWLVKLGILNVYS